MDISEVATQSSFAELVGVTQQAIQKYCKSGILVQGKPLSEWLIAYCDRLRNEAAGRIANETKVRLDEAKTRESLANAASKELALYKEQSLVYDKEQVKQAMEEWTSLAKSEFINSVSKIIGMLESKHNIQIDQARINDIVDSSTRVIGDFQIQSGDPD